MTPRWDAPAELPRSDDRIHPVLAVLILLAVSVAAWAGVLAVVLATLVVAGSWGLLALVVGVAAVGRGVR